MSLEQYFKTTEGTGFLSTADKTGAVNAAVYAKPHLFEDGTAAFIMTNSRSYKNIQETPHAVYLYREGAGGFRGKRLYLTKTREEQDTELLQSLRRRTYSDEQEALMKPLHLVFFKIDSERKLVDHSGEK